MRFTLIKDIKQDSIMKPVLTFLLLFTLLYIIVDIFVKNLNFGISYYDVHNTLFGNADEFLEPMEQGVFLEFWHMEIFFSMMILFTLCAVYIRLSTSNSIISTSLLMLSALVSLISIILAFYFSDFFIYIYLSCYFTWHLVAFYMIIISLGKLYNV